MCQSEELYLYSPALQLLDPWMRKHLPNWDETATRRLIQLAAGGCDGALNHKWNAPAGLRRNAPAGARRAMRGRLYSPAPWRKSSWP